ncbi:MAG: sulfatase [bacterium]|nr:sulfatase [bacterium]
MAWLQCSSLGAQQGRAGACHTGVTLIVLSALLVGAGCEPAVNRTPNILLVTIDTLRADHLSFYGHSRETMPLLSSWIDEATVFENCFTPLPLTDPALSSLMTGLYPIRHGVRDTSHRLPPRFTTLAEVLQDQGYVTAAFASRTGLVDKRSIGRGFDVVDYQGGASIEGLSKRAQRAEHRQRRADRVTHAMLDWLDDRPDGPFFIWLHYFDPHAFYNPPAKFADAFMEGLEPDPATGLRAWWGSVSDRAETRAAYDGEIATVDHHLGRVVSALRRQGVWDDTLFVLTSDHGESLGERGHMDHGEWLYHEQVRVPLAIRFPGRVPQGMRVPNLVRLIDIAPSVLELAGVGGQTTAAFLEPMDGASFVPLLDNRSDRARSVFIESEDCPNPATADFAAPGMTCHPSGPAGKIRALFDGRWKLIVTPLESGRQYELYDLTNDPTESTDLSALQPERRQAMEQHIDRFWRATAPVAPVDPKLRDQLRELGYLD